MVSRCVALIVAGSVVVTLQTLMQQKKRWNFCWVWTLLISCCSWAAFLAVTVLDKAGVGGPEKVGTRKVPPLLLAGLWTGGALVATLHDPFSVTGNGYFGVWAALAASWALAAAEHGFLREPMERLADACGGPPHLMAVLFAASITAFLQTSFSCTVVDHWCNGNAAWVMVCSAISLALCVSLMVPQVADAMKPNSKFVALFFLVWWAAGAVVTTFEDPYAATFANGYFSCWAAVASALFLTERNFGLNVSEEALSRVSQVTGGTPQEVLGLLLASLVALIAASIDCGAAGCGGFEVWAVVCSSVSLAVCFFVVIYTIRGGWVTQGPVLEKVSQFLFGWWVLGTSCMTFRRPFHILGNGYFAAWAALIASTLLVFKYVEKVRVRLGDLGEYGRELCFVALASIVLFMQAAWDCGAGQCSAGRGWGMFCSFLSLSACAGIAFFHDAIQSQMKWGMAALFLWWSIGVFSLTFCTTYVRTGNSYFACWGAWAACGRALLKQFPELKGYADLDLGEGIGMMGKASTADSPTVIGAKTAGVDFGSPAGLPPIAGSGDFEIGETPDSEGASAGDFYVAGGAQQVDASAAHNSARGIGASFAPVGDQYGASAGEDGAHGLKPNFSGDYGGESVDLGEDEKDAAGGEARV